MSDGTPTPTPAAAPDMSQYPTTQSLAQANPSDADSVASWLGIDVSKFGEEEESSS